jgi:hypothetical protein
MSLSNNDFIQALFKEDAPFCHVTDFTHDPGNIPNGMPSLIAWKGNWFSRYHIQPGSNQYFTISIFNPDKNGVARRQKALFLRTRVIVLDDVKEKLSMDAVSLLPEPSWILETSPGSEQWGYILTEPCHDRGRVENLLDGLVANGLAPDGKDPGMKGATRYVRLPEGYNSKASKMVGGLPFKCQITLWHPERTTTLEALAAPFHVNLDALRRETRTDGAADIPDHPLLHIPDIINVKEVRSNGRFDITCPWVDEHTGNDDSGTAIFTNDDGSIGFKCHHGGCAERTARHLVHYIEQRSPGFGSKFSNWQVGRVFSDITTTSVENTPEPSFIQPETAAIPEPPKERGMDDLIDALRRERPTTPEARSLSQKILRLIEGLPVIDRQHWHNEVCDLMDWSKLDFRSILKDLRASWYTSSKEDTAFIDDFIFINEQNRFYDYNSRIFYTAEAFQNSYSDVDAEIRKTALQEGAVTKVEKIDFAPRQPRVFKRDGISFGNTWCASKMNPGKDGDCSKWFDHWDHLGWSPHRDHHMKWMAYTLKHPEDKINHMLLLGGMEGTGKDFLLYPLIKAMGEYSTTIDGNELLEGFNDYILSTKHLHINETELGDHRHARQVSNKLKPLAAAPPDTVRVNQKGITALKVSNIVNATMTTNSKLPIQLNGPSRRFHAVWTELSIRDENDDMLPKWVDYWNDRWEWMTKGKGFEQCVHYLMNKVDISNFNPGEAPPMTAFLREIRESSKSPMLQTMEAFIRSRMGCFASDLVTSSEMSSTIRAAVMTYPDMIQADASRFTPTAIGRLMSDIHTACQMTGRKEDRSTRMWVIRDKEKYMAFGVNDIMDEYERQIKKCAGKNNLQLVK